MHLTIEDTEVIDSTADLLAAPGVTPSNSFELHAALELLARRRLLELLPQTARPAVRARISEIGARFPRATVAQEAPVTIAQLEAAVPVLVDALGAAAHGSLLVVALRDVPSLTRIAGPVLRSLHASPARLTWHRRTVEIREGSLWRALANPPHVESKSTSIAPTMLAVESLAASTLPREGNVEQTCARLAALSMLAEPDTHAAYGWTHALTLPQGMARLTHGTPHEAAGASVAATYLLGFRATLGAVTLPDEPPTLPTPVPVSDWQVLLLAAAVHPDAHVAKYAVACVDAATADPSASGLFHAALARLLDVWARGTQG